MRIGGDHDSPFPSLIQQMRCLAAGRRRQIDYPHPILGCYRVPNGNRCCVLHRGAVRDRPGSHQERPGDSGDLFTDSNHAGSSPHHPLRFAGAGNGELTSLADAPGVFERLHEPGRKVQCLLALSPPLGNPAQDGVGEPCGLGLDLTNQVDPGTDHDRLGQVGIQEFECRHTQTVEEGDVDVIDGAAGPCLDRRIETLEAPQHAVGESLDPGCIPGRPAPAV